MELIRNDYNTLPQQVEENKENLTNVSNTADTAASNAIDALNKAADAITLATTALTNAQNINDDFNAFKTTQTAVDSGQNTNITSNTTAITGLNDRLNYTTSDYNIRKLALYTPVSGSSTSIPIYAGCELVIYRNTPTPVRTPITISISTTPTTTYSGLVVKILGLGVPDSTDAQSRYVRKVLITVYNTDGSVTSSYADTFNQGNLTANITDYTDDISYFRK